MKKLIALFLCLVMVLGLVACGAKEEPKAEPAPEVAETKEPEAAPEVVPEQPEEVAPELGTLPLVTEDTTLTIGIMQNPNAENYETNEYTKWIEAQTGVNLEFVYFSNDKTECTTQLNLMIAGGEELPDILWGMKGVESALMFELGEDGYLVDIKDYFTDYGYWFWEIYNEVIEADREKILQYVTDPNNGAIYGFPRYSESKGDNCATGAVINAAWLEAVGAEAPTTVDELYEVLKKFATEDPNGNGVADEISLIGYEDGFRTDIVSFIINAYVHCVDQHIFNATDGELWVPYTTDEYRQALIFLNKLYSEGLLSPMFYTITEQSELTALMTPADGTAICGVAGISTALHLEKENPAALEYVALSPLKAATDLGGYAAYMGNTYNSFTFITSDCEDPVLAFKLLDFMTCQESFLRMRFGVFGEDWVYAEEGAVSNSGGPAAVNVLNSSAYGQQSNHTWHTIQSTIMPLHLWANAWTDDGSWASQVAKNISQPMIQGYEASPSPEEIVQTLIYTTDEQEYVSSVKTLLMDYVSEARAMFISGVMDPGDDAAWNTYLANLEAQGLSQYVATAQAAYTRMTAE